MNVTSIEGLAVTLLLLVPGGFGAQLRRWIYPAREPSPFTELLHALGASAAALIVLEAGAAAYGWISGWPGTMGDALLRPLASAHGIPTGFETWAAYLFGFLPLALSLPALAGRLRRTAVARRVFGRVALYDSGADHLFEEIWAPPEEGLAPWVVVETTDGRSLQGQVIWRTTSPHSTELLLVDVLDVTDPEMPRSGGGSVLWIPSDVVRRVWLVVTDASASVASV